MKFLSALVLALSLATAAQAAKTVLPGPGAFLGKWDFSGDTEGTAACVVEFRQPTVIGGYQIVYPRSCARVWSRMGDVASWRPAPGHALAFADAVRHTMLSFYPTGGGDFIARTDDGAGYVLTRHYDHSAPLYQGATGPWRLVGLGGAPIFCDFTFQGGPKAGALRPTGVCKKPWRRDWTGWSLTGNRLVLNDKTGAKILSFKRDDAVTYEGQTPSHDLIYLVRP